MGFNLKTRSMTMMKCLPMSVVAVFIMVACSIGETHDDIRSLSEKGGLFARMSQDDFIQAVESTIPSADNSQLRKMVHNADPSVALQAYWETVQRVFKEKAKAPTDTTRNREAYLNRFLGFLEGRLAVCPPRFWRNAITSAHMQDDSTLAFTLQGSDLPLYDMAVGVACPKDTTVTLEGKDWRVHVKGDAFVFPLSSVRHELLGTVEMLSALITEDCGYIVAHRARSSPYNLFCISRESGEILWVTDVWSCFGGPVASESRRDSPSNLVSLVEGNDCIFVFGATNRAVYMEGFGKKDGQAVVRFSTSRYEDYTEARKVYLDIMRRMQGEKEGGRKEGGDK